MKQTTLFVALSCTAMIGVAAPDTVLVNGLIYPQASRDLRFEAMAVDNGRVTALGSTGSVRALVGPGTRVIDLHGRAVLPGFNDQHVHPLGAGVARASCRIEQGASLERVKTRLADCVAGTAEGNWIKGGQWDVSSLGVVPQAGMLDEVSPDNPVILTDTSGHSIWANSLAMRLAGVTRETESPAGGVVERLPDGGPSGVFRESAITLVSRVTPAPSEDELLQALPWALGEMARFGITSYTEAAVGYLAGVEAEMDALAKYAEEEGMPLRARACLT